ncbi:MAG: hypothetical protein IKW39_06390 [Alphaproteobacteria bacterium]|nr:hypothetical protein [Alphaproteobacteria bacterium]
MGLIKFDFDKLSYVYLVYQDYWESFKAVFKKNSYKFEVVYTDGFISSLKSDRKKREPLGFILNKEIIRFDAPDESFKLYQVKDFLDNRAFFGEIRPNLPSYATLRYIRKHLTEINSFIEEFNGTKFVDGWYASCSLVDKNSLHGLKSSVQQDLNTKRVYIVHTSLTRDEGCCVASNDSEVFVRIAYLLY